MEKGQYDQAISNYDKALELNPRLAAGYNNRGMAYYSKQEYDKSWEDVKKAQELGYPIPPQFLEDLRHALAKSTERK
jgi:tetratricopeptide (TPR) repeat protein